MPTACEKNHLVHSSCTSFWRAGFQFSWLLAGYELSTPTYLDDGLGHWLPNKARHVRQTYRLGGFGLEVRLVQARDSSDASPLLS